MNEGNESSEELELLEENRCGHLEKVFGVYAFSGLFLASIGFSIGATLLTPQGKFEDTTIKLIVAGLLLGSGIAACAATVGMARMGFFDTAYNKDVNKSVEAVAIEHGM